MKPDIKPPVLAGLFIAQLLSTYHVWQSDLDLFQTLTAIKAAGYLPIPNERVMPTLTSFLPACYGGLFFTLSIGAALSLLSYAAVMVWNRLRRDKRVSVLLIILWAGGIVFSNLNGFSAIATSFWLIIPAVASWLTLKQLPLSSGQKTTDKQLWIHSAVVLMIAILGINFMNINVFLNFRDNLLLSNPIGLRLNNFYYNYTLYAAEVFKSPSQKLLRTCKLSIDDKSLKDRVEKQLLYYDYFCVDADISFDLEMNQTEAEKFLQQPSQYLKKFSETHDSHAFFRSCVWLSIIVLPFFILYVCIYGLFRIVSVCFRYSPRITIGTVLFFCGISIISVLIYQQNKSAKPVENLSGAITSDNRQQRFDALRWIAGSGFVDIAEFDVSKILNSPDIPERHLLIRALGRSSSPKAYDIIIKLTDDPQFNIAYTAYATLGKRGEQRAIPEILKRLPVSDNWYVQNYAYKALRKLGWRQSKSK
jgi:hypothetical protein